MKLAPIIPIRRNKLPPEKDGWVKLVQGARGSAMVGQRQLMRCLPRNNGARNFQNCHHGGLCLRRYRICGVGRADEVIE